MLPQKNWAMRLIIVTNSNHEEIDMGKVLKDSTLKNVISCKTKMGQSTFQCDAAREWTDYEERSEI